MTDPQPNDREPMAENSSARVREGVARRRTRRSRHRRRSTWAISLNLTPMIDIVFLLLFFFLVQSRFRAAEGMLPARLPAPAVASVEVPRTPIRVRFLPAADAPDTCHVTIEGFQTSPIPIEDLASALRNIQDPARGFDATTPVHLLAGDEIAWDHVVNAYNAALAARFERVYFAATSTTP